MTLTRNERIALNQKQNKVIVGDGVPVDTDLTEGLSQIRKTSEGLVEYIKSDNVVYKKVLDESGKMKERPKKQTKIEKSILEDDLDSNGYVKFANGLIIQWGKDVAPANSASSNLDYPIAFSSAVFSLVGSKSESHAGASDGNDAGIVYISLSQYRVYSDDSERTVNWIAIGN